MAEFEQLIGPLLKREGGYSDRKADRGGPTNLGITQKTLDRWNATSKNPLAGHITDVRGMTREIATAIYWESFWNVAGCQRVPTTVREIHFDSSVQHSPRRAVLLLQEAAGAKIDGSFGPNTEQAANLTMPVLLYYKYIAARYRFYGDIIQRDKTQLDFIAGWMDRMEHFK